MNKRFSNAKDSDYDFSEPCKLTRQQRQTENLRQSWFDSNTRHMGIQLSWLEHLTVNQRVLGSSPSIPVRGKRFFP